LEHDGIVIHHTEHILAAIAGLGLDNVRVELDGDRIPVVTGGSCLGFSQALALAGRVLLPEPRTVFRLKRPFEMNDDLDTPAGSEGRVTHAFRHVLGTPASEFSARYYFQVPTVPAMPSGLAEFAEGRDDFMTVLASARTYYLRVEQPELSRLLSSARHEYIVLDEKSSWELVHEVARHKLVDFWGDLRLLGKPLRGRFVAHRTGHGFHHELVRRLVYGDYLETLELAESKVSHDHD
jgi:UDP-3-O-acyl-N-acetylglucosamine deacetylase